MVLNAPCKKCLAEFTCYKNVILLPAGYWRTNLTTDAIFPCDTKRASCIGEINRTAEEAAVRKSSLNYYCSEGKQTSEQELFIIMIFLNQFVIDLHLFGFHACLGNIGPLCGDCDLDAKVWSSHYYNSSKYTCEK